MKVCVNGYLVSKDDIKDGMTNTSVLETFGNVEDAVVSCEMYVNESEKDNESFYVMVDYTIKKEGGGLGTL